MVSPECHFLYAFATPMEFEAIFPAFKKLSCNSNKLIPLPQGDFACILGMGMLEFSVNLSRILEYCKQSSILVSAVLNVGICGAYPHSDLQILDVVRVDSETVGDIGFQEWEGSFVPFSSKVYLTMSSLQISASFMSKIQSLKAVRGLTVNCCTGTLALAKFRSETFGAQVESMEGAAAFAVCNAHQIPVFQIRAVSNIASTRDKSQWKITEALDALRKALFF